MIGYGTFDRLFYLFKNYLLLVYVPCFVLRENPVVISVVSILKPRFKCLIYPASWNFNRFTSSSFSVVSGSAICLTEYSADINMHILLTILYIFLMVLIGKSWLNNHSILCRIITSILITIASINWSARVEAETYLSWELRTNMANIQLLNTHLTHSYHRSLQNWKCTLFFHNNWHKVKTDTCHYKGLKGSNRKVSLWGIKNKHGGNPIAESIYTYTGA